MRIRNKSSIRTAYISKLGDLVIPENTTVNVPHGYTECQVREAICPFHFLTLLDGYIINQDDIVDGNQLNHAGIMTKSVYDKDFNNIVDDVDSCGSYNLEVSFNYTDFQNGFLDMGIIRANLNIEEIKITIENIFDSGSISVGDAGDNSRLMTTSENEPTYAGTYTTENQYVYLTNTLIKLYMQGSPTMGSGKAIVFIG